MNEFKKELSRLSDLKIEIDKLLMDSGTSYCVEYLHVILIDLKEILGMISESCVCLKTNDKDVTDLVDELINNVEKAAGVLEMMYKKREDDD